tara:strand:+ start:10082 stop:11296 length:1215 start_codon:yes stop_codon:yes gene_type:complete
MTAKWNYLRSPTGNTEEDAALRSGGDRENWTPADEARQRLEENPLFTPPDGSDNLKQSGQAVSFYHESSGNFVRFKAFIMAFNESFMSDWSSEAVYGRMDPIMMFKNTTRKVTLAFKIPAFSAADAMDNLADVQKLISFLYPNYEDQFLSPENLGAPYAQNISNSPLVRLRVVNFLSKAAGMNKDQTHARQGTLGAISNLVVNYNLDAADGVIEDKDLGILPRLIDVNMDFSVLHERPLGWNSRDKFMAPSWPYNMTNAGAGRTEARSNAAAAAAYEAAVRNEVEEEWAQAEALHESAQDAPGDGAAAAEAINDADQPGSARPSDAIVSLAEAAAGGGGLAEPGPYVNIVDAPELSRGQLRRQARQSRRIRKSVAEERGTRVGTEGVTSQRQYDYSGGPGLEPV